ncbi:MAG: hypothetical protein ACP5JT_03335 [Thermoplasmata archaeon]
MPSGNQAYGGQAAGIYGEIYETMRGVLQKHFGEKGTFSIRKFIREQS